MSFPNSFLSGTPTFREKQWRDRIIEVNQVIQIVWNIRNTKGASYELAKHILKSSANGVRK